MNVLIDEKWKFGIKEGELLNVPYWSSSGFSELLEHLDQELPRKQETVAAFDVHVTEYFFKSFIFTIFYPRRK